jgi:peptidoglycan/LPS O-acetylase OafA/YrhL
MNAPGWDPQDRLLENLQRRVIPGLDGIRGIAALCVVMFHGISERFPGAQAVNMFFVLSGMLITWLLLAEERRDGAVNLRAFYCRRAFRLLPPVFALIAWELVINRPRVSHQSLLAVAFYCANYYTALGGQLGALTHTWSLAVEEHFYLIWPAVFLFTANRARLTKWLLALAFLSAFARVIIANFVSSHYALSSTETNATALLVGCAIALVIARSPYKIPRALFHPLMAPLSLVALVCLAQVPKNIQYVWACLGVPLEAIILLNAIAHEWRILENPVAHFLGRISYGVYLWQFVAIWMVQFAHLAGGPVGWIAIPAASILLATVSHYVLERPAQSAGRMVLARINGLTRIRQNHALGQL